MSIRVIVQTCDANNTSDEGRGMMSEQNAELLKAAAKPAQATSDLESLPKAMAAIPTKPTRATGSRWLLMYPDLGLRIGGRRYLWRAAREAIGRGVPLEQAAAIGRACRERNQ